jgi:hypothetical protein
LSSRGVTRPHPNGVGQASGSSSSRMTYCP